MSSQIRMEWNCPACQRVNAQACQKPTYNKGSILTVSCGLCKNEFLMKVVLAKGQLGKVGYVFLDGPRNALSEKEIDELLTAAQAAQPKEEV